MKSDKKDQSWNPDPEDDCKRVIQNVTPRKAETKKDQNRTPDKAQEEPKTTKQSKVNWTPEGDIQKLIEEVTSKKEEKWTKEQVSQNTPTLFDPFIQLQDDYLVKLVSIYKVENINVVHEKLNQYIEQQKAKAPVDT